MADGLSLMRQSSRRMAFGIGILLLLYLALLALGGIPDAGQAQQSADGHSPQADLFAPPLWATIPFAGLLLSIALLPLLPWTSRWWHSNRNRFLLASGFAVLVLLYYSFSHPGGLSNHFFHQQDTQAGLQTVGAVFSNAIFDEYIPFIILLFCLYVISGGVRLRGDLAAHPATNCAFLASGALLASFIGTTGAAMVLIRPLLATNQERRHKVHTVIFFIFMVCNCGGLLLPIGDPPLFLGYLRGVPFLWTMQLWPYWLAVNVVLLATYFIWDCYAYRQESPADIALDETQIRPLRLDGTLNLALLAGVVFCVAWLIPGQPLPGTSVLCPVFMREALMLGLVVLSLRATAAEIRVSNSFDYHAIGEVAALFSGIFICMQVPIEILSVQGAELGLKSPLQFFWATGILSSFLDNAPTYVVFFEAARAMPIEAGTALVELAQNRTISEPLLSAISLGAVFMGAGSYIGNGPNFMVKSIAERQGVKMPSFFGYMVYAAVVLIPVFVVVTLVL